VRESPNRASTAKLHPEDLELVAEAPQNSKNMKMVPFEEFEALKALTIKMENDWLLKCEQKDLYIESLRSEIDRMRGEFAIDFEEFKLQHEIKTQDLE